MDYSDSEEVKIEQEVFEKSSDDINFAEHLSIRNLERTDSGWAAVREYRLTRWATWAGVIANALIFASGIGFPLYLKYVDSNNADQKNFEQNAYLTGNTIAFYNKSLREIDKTKEDIEIYSRDMDASQIKDMLDFVQQERTDNRAQASATMSIFKIESAEFSYKGVLTEQVSMLDLVDTRDATLMRILKNKKLYPAKRVEQELSDINLAMDEKLRNLRLVSEFNMKNLGARMKFVSCDLPPKGFDCSKPLAPIPITYMKR